MIINKTNINQFINGTTMDCSECGITEIEFVPGYITNLYCWNNQLTSLPKLPDGLTFLNCNSNQLTELPLLPNSLKYLFCSNNKLINYPTEPLSEWIKHHNKSINRQATLNKLLNENR